MAFTATTVALASLAVAAIGTGVGTYAAIAQADAAEEAANLEAKQHQQNAALAADAAQYEAEQIRRRNKIIRGRQAAVAAKSGIDLSSGTFLDITLDSAVQGEMDAMAAIYSGKVAGGKSRFGADVARKRGATAKQAGYFNAGSTVLTGAGNVMGAYGNYRRQSAYPDF